MSLALWLTLKPIAVPAAGSYNSLISIPECLTWVSVAVTERAETWEELPYPETTSIHWVIMVSPKCCMYFELKEC